MARRRPTIIDVAKHAGVSKSTVSLVLKDSPLIKPQTRALVKEAIKATNYVYNRSAANLRGSGAGLAGLVINDLRNPYYAELAASVQAAFLERGYATVVANTDEDPDVQVQVINSMLEHGVATLMIAPSYGAESALFDAIKRAGVPAMQVLRCVDQRADIFPFHSMDYDLGGFEATRHLAGRGAKRIVFVGGVEEREVTVERKQGYERFLTSQGREPLAFHGASSRLFGYEMALKLAKMPEIDGAVAFNDLVALGMLAGFAEAGIKVGEQFRLVGFDDIEEAALSFPKLSSVACDVGAFGYSCAQKLLDWLEFGRFPEGSRRFDVELVVRETS